MKTLDLFRLDGRIAIVSGGAGIVGTPIVRGLAEAGATVIVASRTLAACEDLARALSAEGLRVEAEQCDFSAESEILALRDRVLAKHLRVDVLFNNAVSRACGEFFDMAAEDWDCVMALNSTGFFLSCRIFAEVMANQGGGSIVNIASIYGMGGPRFSIYDDTPVRSPVSYSFAKGGMLNMTKYLASFLAPRGVRVNAISPGGVRTNQPEQFISNYERSVPMGRMANPHDIQGAAVFLASDASAYVTGQNIAVDGGWTAI